MTYSLLPIMNHCLPSDNKTSPVLFFSLLFMSKWFTFLADLCCSKKHETSGGFSSIYSSSASFVLKNRRCISPAITTVLQLGFFPRQYHPVLLYMQVFFYYLPECCNLSEDVLTVAIRGK